MQSYYTLPAERFWANEAQSRRRSRNTRDGGMAFFCAFPVARMSRDSCSLRACLRSVVLTSTESTWKVLRATPRERSRAFFRFLHVLYRMRQNRTSKGKVLEALGWGEGVGALRAIRARAGAGARFPHAGALTFYSSHYLYFTCTSFLD